MNLLFQTGTSLSAENLNRTNLVNSNPGVIEGCLAYAEGQVVHVNKGTIMFSDGAIATTDGTETIDASSISGNGYSLVAVRYGNDVDLELLLALPENYEYVVLASVDVGTYVSVSNVGKSNEEKRSLVIDGIGLSPQSVVLGEGIISANQVIDALYMDKYLAVKVDSEGEVYIPFTHPGFDIRRIELTGKVSSDTELMVSVQVNSSRKFNSSIFSASSFDNGKLYISVGDSLAQAVLGDRCAIALTIKQTSGDNNVDSDLSLVSVVLRNEVN